MGSHEFDASLGVKMKDWLNIASGLGFEIELFFELKIRGEKLKNTARKTLSTKTTKFPIQSPFKRVGFVEREKL